MKNILIGILIIGILILVFLFIKEKDKAAEPTYIPDTEQATLVNNSQTNTEEDIQSIPSQEEPIQPGLYVFNTSNGNPSARSTTRQAIISGRLRHETANPICGNGNEYVAPCEIFLIDTFGGQRHVSNWPNVYVYPKYPAIFPPAEMSDLSSYQRYGVNNFYVQDSLLLDGDYVSFDTRQMEDCGGYDTQHWIYNIQTKEYTFLGQEAGPVGDCV